MRRFWLGFVAVIVLVAGGLSYLASSQPDGLDSATRRGCEVSGEELRGTCIAQHADAHALAGSPLADYTIAGHEATVGVAGLIGVAVTLLLAAGLFRLIARRRE
ncbi:PDGLE domain-containing protein [Mycobacterium sp. MYCO198283]|uniref:PDGLE domain-containing protein n=1 Tax=Mycobacterium sp. MYCO198283 TaxID=2883505 RepID=UPI001E446EDC|nr:PDGLE domain-containing protein [Mycobacterium sp. MYCO198283]MCG5433782.1 PDGLE domain-containing protein [Mycobacterium sp. MYCO198283]